MGDTIWTIVVIVLLVLCVSLSPVVIYLFAWRGMQRVLGPLYSFSEFMEEIRRIEAENPHLRPPMF